MDLPIPNGEFIYMTNLTPNFRRISAGTADSSDLGENIIYFMGVEFDINYLVDINTMVNIYWSYYNYKIYFRG